MKISDTQLKLLRLLACASRPVKVTGSRRTSARKMAWRGLLATTDDFLFTIAPKGRQALYCAFAEGRYQ